jgi:hypothetical protein
MPAKVSKEEVDAVLRLFDDRRALIASGKVQRWEVVKWAVTVNVALGAASATVDQLPALFFAFSGVVAVTALALLYHYDLRITQIRGSLASVNAFIRDNIIDINAIGRSEFDRPKGSAHDRREMGLLYSITVPSGT